MLTQAEEKSSFGTIPSVETQCNGSLHDVGLEVLGYQPAMQRNRSLFTLLFQTLAICAVPFGEGSALMSAIYGGGPLSIFVGWLIVLVFDECVAVSLGELASRYPTAAGPYYWSYQLANRKTRTILSFVTGYVWLIGNWTITLSVNFGCASMIAATVSMYHEDFNPPAWQLLLIFYAVCLTTLAICTFGNRFLPMVDTVAAVWTLFSIIIILIALSVSAKAGRHDAAFALAYYDDSFSGWGGFTFFIGLLPAAYTFAAIGMIISMAEETAEPALQVPRAISLCVPISGILGLFFILPICFTLPPMEDIINAPSGQALPYIFYTVMGSPGGGLGLIFLVLGVTMFCSISITTAASRCTWAFARDDALPLSRLWSKIIGDVPVPALLLVTFIEMLLGLINLGSASAFTAFASVGVVALAVSYAIPIGISFFSGRHEVNSARWNCGPVVGRVVNAVALVWISFELVLFSMPTALPVTAETVNYASVVFVGFLALSAIWYGIHARKCKSSLQSVFQAMSLMLTIAIPVYKGPPESAGM